MQVLRDVGGVEFPEVLARFAGAEDRPPAAQTGAAQGDSPKGENAKAKAETGKPKAKAD